MVCGMSSHLGRIDTCKDRDPHVRILPAGSTARRKRRHTPRISHMGQMQPMHHIPQRGAHIHTGNDRPRTISSFRCMFTISAHFFFCDTRVHCEFVHCISMSARKKRASNVVNPTTRSPIPLYAHFSLSTFEQLVAVLFNKLKRNKTSPLPALTFKEAHSPVETRQSPLLWAS